MFLQPDVVATDNYHHVLDGVVCNGQSDFFHYDVPCDGYLGFELLATDFEDQNDDLTLVLTDDSETELVVSSGNTIDGAHRLELAHQVAPEGGYTVEVRHEGGGGVPYALTTYFLPTGNCDAADWTCEANGTLVATETACADEPLSGACDAGDVVTTTADLPTVGLGFEGFDGWLVTMGAGEVTYHSRPSTAELAVIAGRCQEACEAQWTADDHISANCSSGFLPPEVFSRPGYSAEALILPAMQDGSGLFASQSLSCSLHDTCEADFDEALHAAIPTRVTPAGHPLGIGQEWELTVDGTTTADSTFATGTVDAAMVGTIGYSFCDEGDGVNCPFYLGSMHLQATETLDVVLNCGAGAESHTIADLTIDLAQPAFGIAEVGSSYKAFPPAALIVQATATVDSEPVSLRAPIFQPIFYQAGQGWSALQGSGGAYITLLVPCGAGVADVKLWWSFDEDTTTASPPDVALNLPASVSCPGQLELLLASGSDPDDDIASLRWLVDGVLLSDTWPTIDFTEDHEITAVIRDDRGATTSDTATVVCQ